MAPGLLSGWCLPGAVAVHVGVQARLPTALTHTQGRRRVRECSYRQEETAIWPLMKFILMRFDVSWKYQHTVLGDCIRAVPEAPTAAIRVKESYTKSATLAALDCKITISKSFNVCPAALHT